MDELASIYSDYDYYSLPEDFNLDVSSLGANPDFGLNFDRNSISNFMADPQLFAAFAELNPEDAALLQDMMGGDYGFAPVGSGDVATGLTEPPERTGAEDAALLKGLVDPLYTPPDSGESAESETRGTNTTGSDISKLTDTEKNKILTTPFGSVPATGVKGVLQQFGKGIEDLTGIKGLDAAKYAAIIAAMKMAYDDAERARKEAKGWTAPSTGGYTATRGPKGTSFKKAASGGVMSLDMAKGRYLGGMTDGMADKVPAHIDNKRPAALSDGEFVIPADVVSHLGNGNSNAGAKRLYKMMDDIREARTGNREQGVQINPNKFMPR